MQMPDKSTNSHTRVHFIINDTKQNCPYLTKGASFHSSSRVFLGKTLSQCLFPSRSINEYQHIVWEAY